MNKGNGTALSVNAQVCLFCCSCCYYRDASKAADPLEEIQWQRVIFADENWLHLFRVDGSIRIWWESGLAHSLQQHEQIADQKGVSLHVWVGIITTTSTEVILLQKDNYGALSYYDHLMPFIHRTFSGTDHCCMPVSMKTRLFVSQSTFLCCWVYFELHTHNSNTLLYERTDKVLIHICTGHTTKTSTAEDLQL